MTKCTSDMAIHAIGACTQRSGFPRKRAKERVAHSDAKVSKLHRTSGQVRLIDSIPDKAVAKVPHVAASASLSLYCICPEQSQLSDGSKVSDASSRRYTEMLMKLSSRRPGAPSVHSLSLMIKLSGCPVCTGS